MSGSAHVTCRTVQIGQEEQIAFKLLQELCECIEADTESGDAGLVCAAAVLTFLACMSLAAKSEARARAAKEPVPNMS